MLEIKHILIKLFWYLSPETFQLKKKEKSFDKPYILHMKYQTPRKQSQRWFSGTAEAQVLEQVIYQSQGHWINPWPLQSTNPSVSAQNTELLLVSKAVRVLRHK